MSKTNISLADFSEIDSNSSLNLTLNRSEAQNISLLTNISIDLNAP